jgi:cell division protein FtsB
MPRPADPQPPDEISPIDDEPLTGAGPERTALDLSAVPVAGLTRRRLAFLAASFVTAWIVIMFARQAGEAAAASARVEAMRASNAALAADVDALDRELDLIQRQAYVVQQASGYRLGEPGQIPFTLSADAPPLGPSAPGSSSVRLGAPEPARSPLESWLSLLFGPGS